MIDIDRIRCDGCGICVDTCPTDAIVLHAGKAYIEQELCRECQICMNSCSQGAILEVELVPVIKSGNTKPYSTPIPEALITDRLGVVSSLLGVAIDAGLALNSPAKENLPTQINGRGQRNGLRRRGGHGQRQRRHKNNNGRR